MKIRVAFKQELTFLWCSSCIREYICAVNNKLGHLSFQVITFMNMYIVLIQCFWNFLTLQMPSSSYFCS